MKPRKHFSFTILTKKIKIAAIVKFCLRKPLILGDYNIS